MMNEQKITLQSFKTNSRPVFNQIECFDKSVYNTREFLFCTGTYCMNFTKNDKLL